MAACTVPGTVRSSVSKTARSRAALQPSRYRSVKRVWLRDVALTSLGLTAAAALAACGRRATEADCRLIVDRSVELQMKEMSNTTPSAIHQRAEQVRGELGDEIKACEGRRVTDKTVSCVQAASTSMDLDKCLR